MINKKLSYELLDQKVSYRAREIVDLLVANYSEDISLNFLSLNIGIAKYNIIKNFKKDFGISPMKWLWIYRTILSAKFIEDYQYWNIKEIASSCGFGSIEHHCRCFKKIFKKSPTNYRKDYMINKITKLNQAEDYKICTVESCIKKLMIPSSSKNAEEDPKMLNIINKISYTIEKSVHESVIRPHSLNLRSM